MLGGGVGGELIVGDEVKSEDGGAVRPHGSLPGTQSVAGWWTSAWELTSQGLWFYWFLKQLSVQFDHARRAAEAPVKPLMPVQPVPDRPHFMVTFCCTKMAGCDACGLWGVPVLEWRNTRIRYMANCSSAQKKSSTF